MRTWKWAFWKDWYHCVVTVTNDGLNMVVARQSQESHSPYPSHSMWVEQMLATPTGRKIDRSGSWKMAAPSREGKNVLRLYDSASSRVLQR